MIVLDTNVVSEPLKSKPEPAVLRWLDAQEPQTLYITSVVLAELLAGAAALPPGRRRDALGKVITEQVLALFGSRVLPFGTRAAQALAKNHASAQAHGNPIGFADCAIASIASAQGFALATRNTQDFKGVDVVLMNPWGYDT